MVEGVGGGWSTRGRRVARGHLLRTLAGLNRCPSPPERWPMQEAPMACSTASVMRLPTWRGRGKGGAGGLPMRVCMHAQ